jgi:hypothetical protein
MTNRNISIISMAPTYSSHELTSDLSLQNMLKSVSNGNADSTDMAIRGNSNKMEGVGFKRDDLGDGDGKQSK